MGAPSPGQVVFGFLGALFSRRGYRIVVAKPTKEILETLAYLAAQGLIIHIGDCFRFNVQHAYEQLETRGTIGKAVFTSLGSTTTEPRDEGNGHGAAH